MSLDMMLTIAALAAGLVGIIGLAVVEHRRRGSIEPTLIPTTPLFFVCAVLVVLALAHMVTLITGSPHQGRLFR